MMFLTIRRENKKELSLLHSKCNKTVRWAIRYFVRSAKSIQSQ